ncbi:MAG: hypothetical protein FWD82_10800 [Defluviitaleaceae bacterium]|nr:hypothetical protein [Defluviitaleaceae bacterium]
MTLSGLLAKLDIWRVIYQPGTNQALYANIIFMILVYVYFRGKRAKRIIDRFSKETDKQRDKGTFWVILYVALSIALAIGIGGAYKPGYLPSW